MSSDSHTVNRAPAFPVNQLLQETRILIVDDETDCCYVLSNILKQKHIRTVFAHSLSEADDLIGQNTGFTFIFLDNHLPDGLGVNHIKHIKKNCPSCKVVMITAQDNQTDRKRARDEGADYFIVKPFSRELIFEIIANLPA